MTRQNTVPPRVRVALPCTPPPTVPRAGGRGPAASRKGDAAGGPGTLAGVGHRLRLLTAVGVALGTLAGACGPASARHGRPAEVRCADVREFVRVGTGGDWDAAARLALALPGTNPRQVAILKRKCMQESQ